MEEDVLQVLRMVESKTVSVDEAARLLEALRSGGPRASGDAGEARTPGIAEAHSARPSGSAEHVVVHVVRLNGPETQLDIRLPLGLARFALRNIPREARCEMKEQGVDMDRVLEEVARGVVGKVADIRGPNFKVEVRLE